MNKEINSSISLISHIHSLSQDFVCQQLSQLGLQDFVSSHGNILFQLSKNGPMSMRDLAKSINRDKSTTTVLVRKLENEGFIKTSCDKNDKRSKNLELTEKGLDLKVKTDEISSKLLETFYDGFSEDEKEQFYSFLKRVSHNFEK